MSYNWVDYNVSYKYVDYDASYKWVDNDVSYAPMRENLCGDNNG